MSDKKPLKNSKGAFSLLEETQQPFNQNSVRYSAEALKRKRMVVSHKVWDITKAGVFFIAPTDLVIVQAQCTFSQAGTDAGAVTLNIEKLSDGQASGAGTTVLSDTFDLKGTINTVQSVRPTSSIFSKNLRRGERLGLVVTGVPTAVENVIIVVEYQYNKQYKQ